MIRVHTNVKPVQEVRVSDLPICTLFEFSSQGKESYLCMKAKQRANAALLSYIALGTGETISVLSGATVEHDKVWKPGTLEMIVESQYTFPCAPVVHVRDISAKNTFIDLEDGGVYLMTTLGEHLCLCFGEINTKIRRERCVIVEVSYVPPGFKRPALEVK